MSTGMNLKKFERYPLTFGPTPIEHLPRMTDALGGKVEIYAKRDDCNSGLANGRNKLRKMEYIVPDVMRRMRIHWSPSAACSRTTRVCDCRRGRKAGTQMQARAGKLGAP